MSIFQLNRLGLIALNSLLLATATAQNEATGSNAPSDTVLFENDSIVLSDAAKENLRRLADWIRDAAGKETKFQIEGHTSDLGPAPHNRAVSQKRAEAVRKFLAAESGADAGRFFVVSLGESQPAKVVRRRDGAAVRASKRAANRRAVVRSLDADGKPIALTSLPEWKTATTQTRSMGKTAPGDTAPKERKPTDDAPRIGSLVDASNHLAADLFRELGKANPDGNLLISPLSISEAMWMTAAGAAGDTETEMRRTLGLDSLDGQVQKEQLGNLRRRHVALESSAEATFRVANALALVGDSGSALPAYQQTLADDFGAETIEKATVETINGWVAEKTSGKIPQLIESLDDNDRLVILNALYFKADWNARFAKEETKQETFTRRDGTGSQVPMMRRTAKFGLSVTDDWEAVGLPYAGGDFMMVALLPKPSSQRKLLEEGLDENDWKRLLKELGRQQEVALGLPRFSLDEKQNLNQPFR
ncbi:MAG TPA: serpin family protein, partial [Bacteroidia bacterium]|nr:serpin family protein [Bacteroidia bacterium]